MVFRLVPCYVTARHETTRGHALMQAFAITTRCVHRHTRHISRNTIERPRHESVDNLSLSRAPGVRFVTRKGRS